MSSLFENDEDRAKQNIVCNIVSGFLSRCGLHCMIRETEGSKALSHDFEMMRGVRLVMVGEIKCRNYDEEFFLKEGWLLSVERFQKLGETFYNNGIPVIYGFMSMDGAVYVVSHKHLLAKWASLGVAPSTFMKDDHGTKQSKETGRIVPLGFMTKANT